MAQKYEEELTSKQNHQLVQEATTGENLSDLNHWSNLIVEGIEVVLFSLDKDWRFTYLNNQAAQIWGRSREALLGKVMWEEFPMLLGTDLEKFYHQAMAQGKPDRMETFSPVTQGWYDVRAYPIPQGLIVFFQDITHRKQLEQALEENEERFKFLSEATFEGIIAYQDGIVVEANESLAQMYGYDSPAELISTPVFNYVAPESLSDVQSRIAENFTQPYEIVILKKDGSHLLIEARGKSLPYRGQTVRVTAIRDITERKLKEQQLKESEERFKALSEATFEAIIIHHNGVTIEANQSAAQMFGYSSPMEWIGLTTNQVFMPESIPKLLKQMTDGSQEAYEANAVRKDGRHFPVELRGKSIEYQGQTVRVVAARDITERKRTEQQLRDSETRYKVLSEAAFEGVIIHHDGVILEANQNAAQMFGYSSSQELIGHAIDQYLSPQTVAEIQNRIAEGSEAIYEGVAIRRDGSSFPVEARGRSIEYQGQTVRVKVMTDISERKQKEQQLQESEARYRVLSEAGFEGLFLQDQGVILEANQRMIEIFGYSLQELIGMPLTQLSAPESLPALKEDITNNNSGVAVRIGLRKDGTRLFTESRRRQIEYRGRKIWLVAIRDITELKQKEQQLIESEARYRVLSEATFEAIVMHRQGLVVEANQTAVQMAGYSSLEEFIGQPLLPLIAPEQLEAVQKWMIQNSLETYESLVVRKDGSRFPVEVRGKVIEYRGQTVRVAVFRDITERKQAEEKLQKTQAQLLQAQKMESVGRLAGGVAHDFNNLLTAIIGYSELLSFSLSEDDPSYSDVMEIQKAANRAAALTRQLLAFSRQQVMEPKVLDLNEVVADMDKLLQRLIGEDIELRSLLASDLGEVLADPGQIEQVIVNLAVNARDAMSNGGKLTIETANVELDEQYRSAGQPQFKTGSYVMLAVSDTGQGMDQATQEKIFEPFFTTKEKGKGTGLGLSTVYGIVNQSEGYIWVYSEVGIGTTFKAFLPRIKPFPAINERKIQPVAHSENSSSSVTKTGGAILEQESTGQGYTVLMVEDDSLVRELIYRVLTQAGYIILEAYNGKQALELLRGYAGKVDLVLTDMVMPQMGGQELIDNLKEKRRNLKVVCMSGYTEQTVAYHETLMYSDAFLQKPFSPTSLLSLIEQVLKPTT